MNHLTRIAFGPIDTGALRLHPLHCHADDLRTLLRQYLLDPVLPVLTLLSISALTVATIVLIVTAMADTGWHRPARPANVDPWAGWCFGPAAMHYDQAAYPGGELMGESWPQAQIEAGIEASMAVSTIP